MSDGRDSAPKSRRDFLRHSGALAAAALPAAAFASGDTGEGVTFAAGPRPLVRYPGKREMILVHARPPHLETPFSTFDESVITPNDAFFVRYHLADIPTSIDPETYRLTVKGAVNEMLSLSLSDLKAMPGQAEIVAVNEGLVIGYILIFVAGQGVDQ